MEFHCSNRGIEAIKKSFFAIKIRLLKFYPLEGKRKLSKEKKEFDDGRQIVIETKSNGIDGFTI